jgi:hypothetical protein
MSKRELKKYLKDLTKEQLEEQMIELYEKFSPVKVYYNFVFNPNEDKILQEYKIKVSNEYFPIQTGKTKRRAKMRRSVAQKFIKHFILLGVDPYIIADAMCYHIEIAQAFSAEHIVKQELFFKSMLYSFEQTVRFLIANGILEDFKARITAISLESTKQHWNNRQGFNTIIENFEY